MQPAIDHHPLHDQVGDLLSEIDKSADSDGVAVWEKQELLLGPECYAEALYQLTRKRFRHDEARLHFLGIISHRAELEIALKRRVALVTAVSDYFLHARREQAGREFRDPVVVEAGLLARNEASALVDELTGLSNRRYFNLELKRELERSKRTGKPFAILIIDIDHFKKVNDKLGHMAGDEVLRTMAGLLQSGMRSQDCLARHGGEEFAAILPEIKREEVVPAAERHRLGVMAGMRNRHGLEGGITVSIGLATFPEDGTHEAELVHRADQALYRAKRLGRNRVCTVGPDKRGHPRFPIKLPTTCVLVSDDHGGELEFSTVTGRSMDISLSGMQFVGNRPIPQGSPVLARIATGTNMVEVPAESVRLGEDCRTGLCRSGLCFTRGDWSQARLGDLIASKTGFSA